MGKRDINDPNDINPSKLPADPKARLAAVRAHLAKAQAKKAEVAAKKEASKNN